MRAAIYARVSSAMQRDRDTIASQLRVLPDFVQRMGWQLVGTYADDGHTAKAGKLERRDGLARLLHDAALGMFDVVVVVDVDRITRSEDLVERGAILGALQRANVKIASSTSGQVMDLSTSTGDLFTTLHAFFAAEWTRKHRERVTQGKITAIQRGRKPAGRAPYGLAYDKAAGAWIVDPVTGPLVREMFKRIAAGESARTVADDFYRRGIPVPKRQWERSRICDIVRSRYAVGEWTADKTRGLVMRVPPIVDEELWQRAQAALNVSGKRGLRRTRHDYLLEGLAVCGGCGAKIIIRSAVWDPRHNGRLGAAAYYCSGRRYFRRGTEHCMAPSIRVDEADARLWAAMKVELEDPELAAAIDREILGTSEEDDSWQADAEGYRRHLARLEQLQAGVLERWRRELISDAGVDAELGRIKTERDMVARQLEAALEAQRAGRGLQERLGDARQVLAELRAVLDEASFEVRRRLVSLLVPRSGITFVGTAMRVTLLVPRSAARVGHAAPVLVDGSTSRRLHETHLRIRLVA